MELRSLAITAFKETGLFANQNGACRLSDDFTRERVLSNLNLAATTVTGPITR